MAPAIMGNVVVWKPSDTAVLGSYRLYEFLPIFFFRIDVLRLFNLCLYLMARLEALHEAGMPPGVVQFVPGIAQECGRVITESPHLAALHFTGSTSTFNHLWRSISANISKYAINSSRF
jgi:1-pyrroline-5-carboxylate dehydrogenase